MKLKVDCSKTEGKLKHFWKSTGFTPAELLLQPDMEQTLSFYGSVFNNGIKYVRIHYLLKLVTVLEPAAKNLEYDWTALNKGLDVIINNNLKPFFELMGNPAPDFFTDFTDEQQSRAWKNFIKELALHCIERYGREEVRSWYFETTNEPDVGWDWGWGGTVESFCNYYDACSAGLKEADSELIFGGPGTCQSMTPFLKRFLQHIDQGKNHLTGEQEIRIDFISIHEKGVKAHKEDLNPDSMGITEREIGIWQYIKDKHPRLQNKPFMNNECDPQVGWGDIHTWRAKPYYPAAAVKIINQHLVKFDQLLVEYDLLSNDNGFMGTWGNRTLLSRIGSKEDIEQGKFSLIKMPILNMMTMLSQLGDSKCKIYSEDDISSEAGVIAAAQNEEVISIVIYNSRDKIMSSGSENMDLTVENIPFSEGIVSHYRIDETHGNPFSVWEKMGAPDIPDPEQLKKIRNNQELTLLEDIKNIRISNHRLNFEFELPLPGVSLIKINKKSDKKPEKIKDLTARKYRGLYEDQQEVLLTWEEVKSPELQTYEVFCSDKGNNYKKINQTNFLDSCFIQLRNKKTEEAFYKVRACFNNGHKGEFSETVKI